MSWRWRIPWRAVVPGALAILFTGLAVDWGVSAWLHARPATLPAPRSESVWVVATAVPANTPLGPSAVVRALRPVSTVPPGAWTGTPNGLWSTEALQPGTVLLAAQVFRPAGADVVADRLPRTEVAINLSVPAPQAADGIITPGDRIGILVTGTAHTTGFTTWFLQQVPVLAVNGSLTGASTPGATEQLLVAVSPAAAAALTYAAAHAALTLAIESPLAPVYHVPPYGAQWPAP